MADNSQPKLNVGGGLLRVVDDAPPHGGGLSLGRDKGLPDFRGRERLRRLVPPQAQQQQRQYQQGPGRKDGAQPAAVEQGQGQGRRAAGQGQEQHRRGAGVIPAMGQGQAAQPGRRQQGRFHLPGFADIGKQGLGIWSRLTQTCCRPLQCHSDCCLLQWSF